MKICFEKYLLLVLLIKITTTFEVKAENKERITPSTWAWKISSETRTVYLLGEHHNFNLNTNILISHKLGFDIYKASSKIWIEPLQKVPDKIDETRYLKNQLTYEVLQSTTNHINKVIEKFENLTESEKKYVRSQYLSDFLKNDPITAYIMLSNLAQVQVNANNLDLLNSPGFTLVLMGYENAKESKKINLIEANNAVSETWWNNCGNKNKANDLIKIALNKFSNNYLFENDLTLETQHQFIDGNNNVNKFIEILLTHPEGKILQDCMLIERNKSWMPLFKESLSTKGAPITFLVGAWHIGGNHGLLELLKKEGYTNITRIYTIE
jgi:uncharacterized protein YbaP (TraB family)